MTLGNMREQGVRHLIAFSLNNTCRHQAVIDVSNYPNDAEVPSFQRRIKCGKCGRRGRWVDVRPALGKEQPGMPASWQGRSAWEE